MSNNYYHEETELCTREHPRGCSIASLEKDLAIRDAELEAISISVEDAIATLLDELGFDDEEIMDFNNDFQRQFAEYYFSEVSHILEKRGLLNV